MLLSQFHLKARIVTEKVFDLETILSLHWIITFFLSVVHYERVFRHSLGMIPSDSNINCFSVESGSTDPRNSGSTAVVKDDSRVLMERLLQCGEANLDIIGGEYLFTLHSLHHLKSGNTYR